jgi:hypothetical protein
MAYYFGKPEIRAQFEDKSEALQDNFRKLCSDQEFAASVETTTKSIDANRIRFGAWAGVLSAISGSRIDSPIKPNEDH